MKHSWKDILVYLQYQEGIVHPISYEMIGKAKELSEAAGYQVNGILIGRDTKKARQQLEGYPLNKVFLYETEEDYFRSDSYGAILAKCIGEQRPSVVLIGGTAQGRALAPRAATRFKTGLTAECTELLLRENSDLVQIRPAFGGNIMAQIITANTRPQFATVRYHVMKPAERENSQPVQFITEKIREQSKISILTMELLPEKAGITEQDILVVAGRGIRRKEDLDMLEELARSLGGELAATRGLVEKGWLDNSRQVGLSGHTVAPKLLIACGVSGSVQFMAGMKRAGHIIAINTDRNARIFDIAHDPICGDLYEIVPELIKKIHQEEQ